MGLWLDDDTEDDGAAPWALGDDLEPFDEGDHGDDPDGGDGSDRWLDAELDRLRPRSVGDAREPVGERGGPDEPVAPIPGPLAVDGAAAELLLRHPAPTRPPRRRRADPAAAADLPAAHVPGYVRDRRGTWRYTATGRAVPGARDLTLRSLYRFPVWHGRIAVPVDLVRSEAELAWCLAWKHRLTTHLQDGAFRSVLRVPVGEWERRADVPFGLWAPELAPTRLLAIADVAELARVTPATITAYLCRGRMPAPVTRIGTSPVWSRPVIRQWLDGRPGQGIRGR